MRGISIGGTSGLARWLGLAIVVATLIIEAALFLPQQSLWLDEATQLSGLSLDPVAVTRWLTKSETFDFGQYPDRMPPASYWLGWAWGRVFGPGETSLRWFGVLCVALASALVFEGARRAFGTAAARASGLVFVTSPTIVSIAVEIRAYPIFLLESAAAFYCLVRLVEPGRPDDASPRRWPWFPGLVFVLILAMATHFYGVTLAGAMFVGLAALAIRGRVRPADLLAASGLLALTALSLWPFVRASIGQSNAATSVPIATRLESVAKLFPVLIEHPSLMVYEPANLCVLVGFLLLLVAASKAKRPATAAIAGVLGAGLAAVVLVEILLDRGAFRICHPNYNLWTRPALCLLAAAGLAAPTRATRCIVAAVLGLVIAAQGVGVYQVIAHGDHFAHGPHRMIRSMIEGLGSDDLAIIHDDDRGVSHFISTPLRYDYGPKLEQFRMFDPSDPSNVMSLQGCPEPRRVESLPHRYLVIIRPIFVSDKELARQMRWGDRPIKPGPIVRNADILRGWRFVRGASQVAFISARLDIFERTTP